MITRLFSLLVLVSGLVGCATSQDMAKLSAPADSRPIVLNEPFTNYLGTGLLQVSGEVIFAAGTYEPEFESDEGVYYRGPIDMIRRLHGAEKQDLGSTDGGLWVSKCSHPKFGDARKVFPYAYGGEPHRNRNLLQDSNDTQRVSAFDVMPVVPPSSIQAGVGTAIGLGIVEAMIGDQRGQIVISTGYPYETKDLDRLSAIVSPQLPACISQRDQSVSAN